MASTIEHAPHACRARLRGALAELEQSLNALKTGRWSYLGLALAGSIATYVAGAWMVRASVDRPPPWGTTTQVQVAASTAAIVTPAGIGWVALNQRFLEKLGVEEAMSRAATGLNMLLTVFSHIALLLISLPFLPTLTLPTVSPPQRRIFVDAAVADPDIPVRHFLAAAGHRCSDPRPAHA